MFPLLVVVLTVNFCCALSVPDMPTVDSCTRRLVSMNDRNWRTVLSYFKACRNLGLTMDDIVPIDFMSKLAKQIKATNSGFLRNTNLTKQKLREIERELNELFQEVSLLAAKNRDKEAKEIDNIEDIDSLWTLIARKSTECITLSERTSSPATTTCTSSTPSTPAKSCKGAAPDDDPFYDYDSDANPISPLVLYIVLLAVAVVTLLITLLICRYVYKIYKYVEMVPGEEDEAAESLIESTQQKRSTRK